MPRFVRVDRMRLPEVLLTKIKRQAERNESTLNGEIVDRLRMSFEYEATRALEDAVALLKKQTEAA